MIRALVVSGGGSRGCYAAGLVYALAKSGRRWDVAFGTSVGALVAARVAQGNPHIRDHQLRRCEDLIADWESTTTGAVLASWRGGVAQALGEGSLYSTTPLRGTIATRLADYPLVLPLWACAVDVDAGAYQRRRVDAMTGHKAIEWLLASCAFPVAMPAVALDGSHWVDGGVERVIPLLDALEAHERQEIFADADDIDAVLCAPPEWSPDPIAPGLGRLERLFRVIELATYQRAADDMRRAYLYWQRMDHKPSVRVWWPEEPPTLDAMRFDPQEIRAGLRQGAGDAGSVRWTFGKEVPTWL